MRIKLRQLRTSKGWTQVKAAEEIGISLDYVKKIESYGKVPSMKVITKIKEVFGCETIDEILHAS